MPPPCGAPTDISDGWQVTSAEAAGLDGRRLCGMKDRLAATKANVHALVVVRHGALAFEQYFSGYDDPWGKPDGQYAFDAKTKHDMRSVSKSVTSLLVGIAIDRKLIASVDEPVARFFPEHTASISSDWAPVTIGHLLSMSSGAAWDEERAWNDPLNDEPKLGTEVDPYRYVLAKPMIAKPGDVWTYNGGGTDLLGEILHRATGKTLDAFARDALFEPLGISDWSWEPYRNNRIAAAAGLRLRPRDAAKIGQLVLDHGQWDGKQIVSASWIAQATTPRMQAIGYFGGTLFYGYQWWMGRSLANGKEVQWVAAIGLGGQRIFIVPSLDMVVVTTSGLYTHPRQGQAALEMLARYIFPAIIGP